MSNHKRQPSLLSKIKINDVKLSTIYYIYKSERAERIISEIMAQINSKNKPRPKRLLRRRLTKTNEHKTNKN